jgi:hypothetical protein
MDLIRARGLSGVRTGTMNPMTRRITTTQVAVRRPIAVLLSAALMLLVTVAGVGGVGGFAALGAAPSRAGAASVTLGTVPAVPASALAAASTVGIPVSKDRRAVPALGTPSSQLYKAGSLPPHPDAADVPVTGWQPPAGLVDAVAQASSAVVALTIQVSHRGRAPPAGSLQT